MYVYYLMDGNIDHFMFVRSWPRIASYWLILVNSLSLMQEEYGETPLHAASGQGQGKVISVLVQKGANLNSLNKVGVAIYVNGH